MIEAFAADVARGPRALVIGGEPGVGKTAFWRHAIERCGEAGHRVLVARPAEEEMALDLVALADLFEGAPLDVAGLRADDDPLSRGRLVLGAIGELADRGPVVLAIDDLQWLDPASARALRFALRRLEAAPVGVLATTRMSGRTDDPLSCSDTLPPGRLREVDLGPLGLEELRRVLARVVTAISRPTLRRIHRVSGGNPLYAIELARGLAADERMRGSGRTLSLPDSIGAAITRRLESAPVELAPLLEAAAGLGPVPVSELERNVPEVDTDDLLALAERLGILVVEKEEIRFSHPLIGETVYARMTPMSRRALHGRLADLALDPDIRARHLALSTETPGADVALLLEQAAERASGRGSFDLAAEFARHSARVTPEGDVERARRRVQLEIENLAAAGEASRALALADELVARQPPGPGRARALVLRSDLENDRPRTSIALLERALEDAGDDEPLRARVLDELAFAHWLSFGAVRAAIECAGSAQAIAERLDDSRLLAMTLSGLAHLEAIEGARVLPVMERAIALEDAADGLPLTTGRRARGLLAKQYRWAGDLEAARTLVGSGASSDEFQRPFQLYDLALADVAAGDFAAAETLVEQGLEAVRDSGSTLGDRWFLYPKALVDAWLGRASEARSTARRLLDRAERLGERPDTVAGRRVLGLLALSEGDHHGAVHELSVAVRLLQEMGVGHPGVFPALPDAVEAAALSGDLPTARSFMDRLERQAAASGHAWGRAAATRCRGIVLLAEGDAAGAAASAEEAAARFSELAHEPDATRAELWRGRALLRDGRRALAVRVLVDARERFARIGARLWEARAAEDVDRAAPGPAGGRLTSTEMRVAQLVAGGGKNREVATTLFMSVATVEAHLTRIYRKLGIRSRSDLARMVVEGGVDVGVRDTS